MPMPGLGEAGMLPSVTKEQEAAAIARLRAKGITNLTRTNIAEEVALGGGAPAPQQMDQGPAVLPSKGGPSMKVNPVIELQKRVANLQAMIQARPDMAPMLAPQLKQAVQQLQTMQGGMLSPKSSGRRP